MANDLKFKSSEYDKSLNPEIDDIRSMVWATACGVADTSVVIYSTPTGKHFVLQTLIINSDSTVSPNTFYFYDNTPTTTPVMKMTVGTLETVIATDMQGISFGSTIFAVFGVASTAQITIGGILRDDRPDGT